MMWPIPFCRVSSTSPILISLFVNFLSSSSVSSPSSHFQHVQPHRLGSRAMSNAVQVSIVNDGPTILGASTTYHATINNVPPDVTAFVCSWTEWKCGRLIPDFSQTNVTDNKCQLSSIYDCSEDVGLHPVFLVVLNDNLKAIGDELSDVTITEHINANFRVAQDPVACNTSTSCTVTTKTDLQMDVDLHDPSNFFQDASITYSWSFGDGTSHVGLLQPTATHTYNSPGLYIIKVNITAVLPADKKSETKTGHLEYPIKLLDSISNLTIKGASENTVRSSAKYNVSCNGSVPVSFCWSMIHGTPDNGTAIENNTCIWTLYSTSCNDSFTFTFNSTGIYHLRVKAVNDVSMQMSESKIIVTIGPVATYSSIAVALIFGIILSLISIGVVVQSYRKQRMRHVEVANFDFQGSESTSDTLSNFARRLRTMVTPPPTATKSNEMTSLVTKKPSKELVI